MCIIYCATYLLKDILSTFDMLDDANDNMLMFFIHNVNHNHYFS